MMRVVLLLLVVAVAILAWRNRQLERTVAQLDQEQSQLRQDLIGAALADPCARAFTSATIGSPARECIRGTVAGMMKL